MITTLPLLSDPRKPGRGEPTSLAMVFPNDLPGLCPSRPVSSFVKREPGFSAQTQLGLNSVFQPLSAHWLKPLHLEREEHGALLAGTPGDHWFL